MVKSVIIIHVTVYKYNQEFFVVIILLLFASNLEPHPPATPTFPNTRAVLGPAARRVIRSAVSAKSSVTTWPALFMGRQLAKSCLIVASLYMLRENSRLWGDSLEEVVYTSLFMYNILLVATLKLQISAPDCTYFNLSHLHAKRKETTAVSLLLLLPLCLSILLGVSILYELSNSWLGEQEECTQLTAQQHLSELVNTPVNVSPVFIPRPAPLSCRLSGTEKKNNEKKEKARRQESIEGLSSEKIESRHFRLLSIPCHDVLSHHDQLIDARAGNRSWLDSGNGDLVWLALSGRRDDVEEYINYSCSVLWRPHSPPVPRLIGAKPPQPKNKTKPETVDLSGWPRDSMDCMRCGPAYYVLSTGAIVMNIASLCPRGKIKKLKAM